MVARQVGEAIGIVAVALAATLTGDDLAAQGRTDLPRPDSSRTPLLTRMPSDSIRYQTAYLHIVELLQALQAGDARVTGALLERATPSSTTCGSVGEAVSRVANRARRIARSDGGTSLAVFFDKIKIVDSGTVQIVAANLVMVPSASGEVMRRSVALALDPESGVWTREAGLLEALCGP